DDVAATHDVQVLDPDCGHPAKIGRAVVERIRDFRRALQRASAERVVETPYGVGVFSDSLRDVYDANYLSVERVTVAAEQHAATADELMEGHHHRRVVAEQSAPGLAGDLGALGYGLSTHLVLAHRARPDRRVDTAAVRVVSLDDLEPVREAAVLAEPWGDLEIAQQLEGAKRRIAEAIPTTFFGAFADGEVAPRHRGRGLGRALVQHALDEGLRRHELVFLEALADDWPRELYAK